MGLSEDLFKATEHPKIYLFMYLDPLSIDINYMDNLHTAQIVQSVNQICETITHRQAVKFVYSNKRNQFVVSKVELWQIKGVGVELTINQILELALNLRANDARRIFHD